MAYHGRFHSLIAVIVAYLLTPIDLLARAISAGLHTIAWPDFKPDGLTALALDRMAHFALTLRLPTIAAQFKAFMERALRHKHFDGEHFDPGRAAA